MATRPGSLLEGSSSADWGIGQRRAGTVRLNTPFLNPSHLVSVTDGVQSAECCRDQGAAFQRDAVIPRTNWRAITPYESGFLLSSRPVGMHRTIGVLRLLPPQVASALRGSLSQLTHPVDGQQIWAHPILGAVLKRIKGYCRIDPPLRYNSIARHDGGLETVTFDRRRGVRLGLHFDNWEHTGLNDADFVPNRISINLGPDDRYFFFVNLTLRELVRLIGLGAPDAPASSKADIARSFFVHYPNYPIVRVRLRPGDAYVAPTENIIHDGGSADAIRAGYHLTIHGRFTILEPDYIRALHSARVAYRAADSAVRKPEQNLDARSLLEGEDA